MVRRSPCRDRRGPGGSGVIARRGEVKEFGSGALHAPSRPTRPPLTPATWNSTCAPDGATDVRAVITDAAGNVHTTAIVFVTVDSTGPSVTLADPGAVVSGTVSLSGDDRRRRARASSSRVSPAGAGTWTEIAERHDAPRSGRRFDTSALCRWPLRPARGRLRRLGNASTASLRDDVRFDNTAPPLISSRPRRRIGLHLGQPDRADRDRAGDRARRAARRCRRTRTQRSRATSSRSRPARSPTGLHVLSGELEDASGTRIPFRVAVTIESAVDADRPPVERSVTAGGDDTRGARSLATVKCRRAAWPTRPSPPDFIVLHVDLSPPPAGPAGLRRQQIVEVTARWALAGTFVTQFARRSRSYPEPGRRAGDAGVVAERHDVAGADHGPERLTLPSTAQDGWYRDTANVHILTHHLTLYGLARDGEPPTRRATSRASSAATA